MLFIHTSNQLEDLSIEYAKQVNRPLSHIFSPEIVVVQNAGMARYLSMQVATISGISANTEYLFPAEFMWRLLRLVSPDIPEKSQCTPETLRFYIMQELSQNSAEFSELSHYIDSEENIWNLSGVLAKLFDKILFYRSEWIQKWEQNPQQESQQNWQARLWIRCVYNRQLKHWLHLQQQFKQDLESVNKAQLPKRVSFFSMSSLSPGYLDLIAEVAQIIDIHLYIINPCEENYWGDISSEKTRARLPLEEQAYFETGNPLLASMGSQGRDFIDQLLNLDNALEQSVSTRPTDSESDSNTLLARLQQDIFNLQQPKPVNFGENEQKVGGCTFFDYKQDNSITFNACHTAMREVEVLYDQILDALNANSDLTPADIVVMMPDVEKYAPYIESIFSASDKQQANLPFSIADRDPLSVHQLSEALLKALKLPESYFDVESVFEILDYEAVQSAFDLDSQAIGQCRELARATNIRWGISARHRQQNELPASDEHTWKYALDRSLLGYSLGETEQPILFAAGSAQDTSLPLLAYPGIEGSDALILSRFKQFSDTLFIISQWPQQRHCLTGWLDKTQDFIQQLFVKTHSAQQQTTSQDTLQDMATILKALDELRSLAEQTEFELEISFETFYQSLKMALQKISGQEKFLGHGITFCAMVPMRSVPFKLVALMGMNDGEYPRQDKQYSFDQVAHKPRRGDRSRRDEDKYLFLESILAARERLIISYIGQSISDNSELPPSVLVSELLDSVSIYTGLSPDKLICKHPLQAFSPRYFSTDNNTDKNQACSLFSYASEYTRLDTQGSQESIPFIEEALEPLETRFRSVSLEELIMFYKNPARTFLQKRFAINTLDKDLTLDTREPFEIERFKKRTVRQIIAQAITQNAENTAGTEKRHQTEQIARARGLLPYGNIGDALFNRETNTVEQFLSQYPLPDESHAIKVSLQLEEFELHGSIDNMLQNNQRQKHYLSELFAGDYIEIWLSHLALNSQTRASSAIYSPEFSFLIKPVDNAQALLQELLEHYWQGLHYPLPFYPKSAFSFYKGCIKGFGSAKPAFYKAKQKWNGNDYANGERQQFENTLLHQGVVLSTEDESHAKEFIHYSELFFRPFVSYLSQL